VIDLLGSDRVVDSIETLYSAHFADGVRLAYLLCGDRAAAEDIAQDAFVKVAARLRRVRDPDKFWAYLRTSITRRVIDVARSEQRRTDRHRQLARMGDTTHGPSSSDIDLIRAVAHLPPRQKAMVVLRFWADLSVPDIARTLGCPAGTVKSGLARALDTLKEGVAQP